METLSDEIFRSAERGEDIERCCKEMEEICFAILGNRSGGDVLPASKEQEQRLRDLQEELGSLGIHAGMHVGTFNDLTVLAKENPDAAAEYIAGQVMKLPDRFHTAFAPKKHNLSRFVPPDGIIAGVARESTEVFFRALNSLGIKINSPRKQASTDRVIASGLLRKVRQVLYGTDGDGTVAIDGVS